MSFLESGLTVETKVEPDSRKDTTISADWTGAVIAITHCVEVCGTNPGQYDIFQVLDPQKHLCKHKNLYS